MKRFVMFGGQDYYPTKGVSSILAIGNTLAECLGRLGCKKSYGVKYEWRLRSTDDAKEHYGIVINWWHVVDLATWTIVAISSGYESNAEIFWSPECHDEYERPDQEWSEPSLHRSLALGFVKISPDVIVIDLTEAGRNLLDTFNQTTE